MPTESRLCWMGKSENGEQHVVTQLPDSKVERDREFNKHSVVFTMKPGRHKVRLSDVKTQPKPSFWKIGNGGIEGDLFVLLRVRSEGSRLVREFPRGGWTKTLHRSLSSGNREIMFEVQDGIPSDPDVQLYAFFLDDEHDEDNGGVVALEVDPIGSD